MVFFGLVISNILFSYQPNYWVGFWFVVFQLIFGLLMVRNMGDIF